MKANLLQPAFVTSVVLVVSAYAREIPSQSQFVLADRSPIKVGPMMQKIIVEDLNGDTNLDLVLTCGSETQGKPDGKGHVAILHGNGRGGFTLAQGLIRLEIDGLKAAVGDLNGDRRRDIVVVGHDSYQVHVLLQQDGGRFRHDSKKDVTAHNGKHPHTHDVALADVNADGKLDVLTTNADDNSVSVLLGDGTGGFQPAKGSPFPAGNHPYEGLAVGDVNGDQKLDIVVPNMHGKAVSVLLGDGTGGFAVAPASPIAVGDRPGFVALGDLNGDSRLDIVVTHDDDPIVDILLGDGRGGFAPAPGSPIDLKERVWCAVVADMNADGKKDLVLGGPKDHALILWGNGAGGFDGAPQNLPVGGKGPGMIAVADVNKDGKLDVITSNFETGDVSVLLQRK